MKKLSIILPCYNEEETLPSTLPKLLLILKQLEKEKKVSPDSFLLCVDDGSSDKTWQIIDQFHSKYSNIFGVKFSRNYGHQNALIAGLSVAERKADLVITIDADLQDDESTIPSMVEKSQNADVIYGVRNNRDTDSAFKKITADGFYWTMKHLGVDMVPNSADFRLMSKRAIQQFLKYDERNMFIRGVVPLVGFNHDEVLYARKERQAGETKYPLSKMIHFALDGITSFSVAPIRIIMNLGVVTALIGIVLLVYSLIQHFLGNTTTGWSSLITSIWFLGGMQLIAISIIGEYIGKIFTEVKHRPRYNIEKDQTSEMEEKNNALE
ncbi:Glycosyltransferase [Furfurilactobacillus rossiae]|uniref:glycosyltransferase family 2 protein n=1 Tax=Furfurilactobacillus rossiae TaxID=231049 RepID=UPI0015B9B40A|nr:glycosyltransferase family 2 protein [Furfurilactobacillus rossiae]MCF6165378.1 glycosyltransferase family 2 protein [Furfurilactobacillus rossiae]QLE63741.1 Glycosyltransferase [Furfurilactobacillus rossiae]